MCAYKSRFADFRLTITAWALESKVTAARIFKLTAWELDESSLERERRAWGLQLSSCCVGGLKGFHLIGRPPSWSTIRLGY